MKSILKVLAGSKAHHLDFKDSDTDYRVVFIEPTRKFLSLDKVCNTQWIEDTDDETGLEVGEFLNQAIHGVPNVIEVFHAPVVEITPFGETLRQLFPKVWNTKSVRDAYINYGYNNLKKFLESPKHRRDKFACLMSRVMTQGYYLLKDNIFRVDMRELPAKEYQQLWKFKSGDYHPGEVVEMFFELREKIDSASKKDFTQETDMQAINDVLVGIRMEELTCREVQN